MVETQSIFFNTEKNGIVLGGSYFCGPLNSAIVLSKGILVKKNWNNFQTIENNHLLRQL